jgi:protease-4
VYVQTVAEGRGLPIEDIKQLADGRPYTAEQALKLKLIDKIGGIEDIYAQELEQ